MIEKSTQDNISIVAQVSYPLYLYVKIKCIFGSSDDSFRSSSTLILLNANILIQYPSVEQLITPNFEEATS